MVADNCREGDKAGTHCAGCTERGAAGKEEAKGI